MKKRMTILVITDNPERVHMALMMAASAAAMGRPVTLFFSKRGAFAVTKTGWQQLTTSDGMTARAMDEKLDASGVADFAILLDALAALDSSFYVCESALAEHAIDRNDLMLRPCIEVAGLASLIEESSGGDWLTF